MNIDFFTWRDGLEIFLFTTAIYYFSVWLSKDRQKNLLGYFYSYCALGFFAYHAQLSGVIFFVSITSPVLFMLFILMHQNTLQKNFIALRNIIPAQKDGDDWLDALMRACLISINNNKEFLCVIEHHDSLHELIKSPLMLNAPLQLEVLLLAVESHIYDSQQLLWVNSQGKLIGMNAQWANYTQPELAANREQSSWKQSALFFTSQTDCLVLHITPTTRTFDIVVNGTSFDAISTHNVVPFIKKYLATKHTYTSQGGNYAHQPQKHIRNQRNA